MHPTRHGPSSHLRATSWSRSVPLSKLRSPQGSGPSNDGVNIQNVQLVPRSGRSLTCPCIKRAKALSALKNMARHRFGRLTVLRRAGSDASGQALWLCRCDCGNRTRVRGRSLRDGRTLSCGCYGRQTGTMNAKHGHAKNYKKSPEYSAWSSMLARCYRPTSDAYPWYGGMGIKVCSRWRTNFSSFLADIGDRPAPDYFLIRRNKHRGYTPSNCEWSMQKKTLFS